MIEIPERLRSFKFIKTNQKVPIEQNWQSTTNYFYNDSVFQEYLQNNKTYGVVGGINNLIIIDFDNKEIQEEIIKELPDTFIVESATKKLQHRYYLTDNSESFKVFDKDKNTLIDVQGKGKMVVGPNSVLNNNNKYNIINNIDISFIKNEDLHKILDIYDYERNKKQLLVYSTNYPRSHDVTIVKESIKISDVLKDQGIDITKNPTECLFHTSIRKKCLSFDDDLGLWHCFHCEAGGDVISFYELLNHTNFKTTLKDIKERYNIQTNIDKYIEEDEREYISVKLHELKASFIGKFIECDCIVSGESNKKAVPYYYTVLCLDRKCNGNATVYTEELPIDQLLEGKDLKKTIQYCAKHQLDSTSMKSETCKHNSIHIEESDEYVDLRLMAVKEIIDHTTDFDVNPNDRFNAYITQANIPKQKKVKIKAKVICERKGRNIALIIHEIEALQRQFIDLSEKDVDELDFYFKKNPNLDQDIDGLINPNIFGRRKEKEAAILTLFSVQQLPDGSRGMLHTAFVGDSKCGKSEIARIGIVQNLGIGDKVIVETSSRTGMLYTIDNDNRLLIWGILPNNDGGFVVLDGMQRLSSEELSEFREVLESGNLEVMRSISGVATARVRIIACLNPQSPLDEYLYRCESLKKPRFSKKPSCFEDEPDITRWDYFLFFGEEDVSKEIIAEHPPLSSSIPIELFKKKLYWVWSRTKEQIIFTKEAINEISKVTILLQNEFATPRLPIVHNACKKVVQRTAIAIANKYNSMTDDFQNVLIEKDHVEKAYIFLNDIYKISELGAMRRKEFEKINITDDDIIFVYSNKRYITILTESLYDTKTSSQLAKMLDVSEGTIKSDANDLKNKGLLGAKQGVGYFVLRKGKRLIKQINFEKYNKFKLSNREEPIYKKQILEEEEKKINNINTYTIVQTNYTNQNIDIDTNNSIIPKEAIKEEIQESQNDMILDKKNYTSCTNDSFLSIIDIRRYFFEMFINHNGSESMTYEEMESYLGWNKKMIEDRAKLLQEHEPKKFYFNNTGFGMYKS